MSSKPKQDPQKVKVPGPKPAGRDEKEFKSLYDKNYIVPTRIKAGLEKLGPSWAYELEFAKLAGVSSSDLAAFREQFEKFVVVADRHHSKRVWAGTTALAARLREMVQ